MSDEETLLDNIEDQFGVERAEIDIDEEELMKKIEESPEWDIEGEMEAAAEVWEQRIQNEEDTEELEFHKERVDDLLTNLQGFQDSVDDLQDVLEQDQS